MNFHIRPFENQDRSELIDITWENRDGFFGNNVSHGWKDKELFYCVFIEPMIQPALSFVAVNDGGRIVGYLVGNANESANSRMNYPATLKRFIACLTKFDFNTLRAFGKLVKMASHVSKQTGYASDIENFPASLHINLRQEAQGHGLGKKLIQIFENELTRRGVKGIQLSTSSTLVNAVPFYKAMGFALQKVESLNNPFVPDYSVTTFVKALRPT